MHIQFVTIALATLVLALFSRRSLAHPGSHGFYRFFAWVTITALLVMNAPVWFLDPFSLRQLFSWSLLTISLVVLWMGVVRLKRAKRTRDRSDARLYEFEKTTELMTSGVYAYIRHPLYASLFYLTWGAFLKQVTLISALLAIVASIFLLATAKADERECVIFFGVDYERYMQHTSRFIPFIF